VAHVTDIRVRFADLDPYNHVNHARYLTFFESARIEMLEEIGFGMVAMQDDDTQIVLVELTAGFHRPAGLHDQLVITTEVVEIKRSTSSWRQEAHCRGELIATLDVRAAFTDGRGRPRRAPDGFAAAVERLGD